MSKWTLILAGWLVMATLWAQRTSATAEWLFADPQETIKTATRTEHKVSESFTTVRVLTRREIELSGAQTVQELLERMVADFEGNESLIHRFLSTRGAYTSSEFNERTLFLLDGIPLNDPILGNFSAMAISTHDVERIEVAFGPGSAMYGPNAFAGVVNIITAHSNAQRSSFFSGYTERSGYNTSLRWVSTGSSGWRWGIQASFWDDPGSNRVRNNDTQVRSLMLNARSGSWNLHYAYLDMDRGSVGMRYGLFPTPYDRFQPRNHYWQAEWSRRQGDSERLARFYGMAGTLDFLRTSPPTFGLNTREKRAFSQQMLGLETLWRFPWLGAQMLAGGDFRLMRASGVMLNGAHDASNFALFLQGEWELGRWRPTLGLRFDAHSIYGNQLNPRAGMVYQLSDHDVLRASLGRAFRAPSFTELFLQNFIVWQPVFNGSQWITVPLSVNGNPQNKPEEVLATEIGWKHLGASGWRWDVAYFRQEVRNAMSLFVVDPMQPLVRMYRNLGRIEIDGWSVELAGTVAPFTELAIGYMGVRYRGNIAGDIKPARDRAVLRLAHYRERGLSAQLTFSYPAVGIGRTDAYSWNTFLNLSYRTDARNRWNLRIDNLFNVRTEMAWRVPGGSRTLWFTYQRDW
jgi:outer membrane cobalamin receptor